MVSFFRGSILSSPFQQAIEKVTDASQATEDWDKIMQICDHVNMHNESAKEAMQVIRKRLQINPATNGWRSIGLTLTLLEALTKNCGRVFHLQIVQKDFLKELRAILDPKNNPPKEIQEGVLGLIQTWAVAFRDDPELKSVDQFYQECKQQGLLFPPAEPDNIVKTAVSATATVEHPMHYQQQMSQPTGGNAAHQGRPQADGTHEAMTHRRITLEQLAKLRSELDVVQTNGQIFGEMLVTLQPGEEHPQDFQLLMELQKTCKQMHQRIMDLLTQISIDDITVDLLRYNDEFNNSFKLFENYIQEREKRVGPTQMPVSNPIASASSSAATVTQSSPTKPLSTPAKIDNEPALIKFDDDPRNLSPSFQNISINRPSSDTVPTKPAPNQTTRSMNIDSASVTTRTVTNSHESQHDDKEVEKLFGLQTESKTKEESHPTEPISEQQIELDLEAAASPSTNKSNA